MFLDTVITRGLDGNRVKANVFMNDNSNLPNQYSVHFVNGTLQDGHYLAVSEYDHGKAVTLIPHRDIARIEIFNPEED